MKAFDNQTKGRYWQEEVILKMKNPKEQATFMNDQPQLTATAHEKPVRVFLFNPCSQVITEDPSPPPTPNKPTTIHKKNNYVQMTRTQV